MTFTHRASVVEQTYGFTHKMLVIIVNEQLHTFFCDLVVWTGPCSASQGNNNDRLNAVY